jgi:hypothetical protein
LDRYWPGTIVGVDDRAGLRTPQVCLLHLDSLTIQDGLKPEQTPELDRSAG